MIIKIICNKQKKKNKKIKEKKNRNYELIIKVSYENLKKMKIRSSLKIWYFVELCEKEKREREWKKERERDGKRGKDGRSRGRYAFYLILYRTLQKSFG